MRLRDVEITRHGNDVEITGYPEKGDGLQATGVGEGDFSEPSPVA
jgi:hypothetical protein